MSEIKTAEKLQLGIEIAAPGLGEVDYLNNTIVLDNRAASFFELPADLPVPRDTLHDRIHPEDRPNVELQVSCLLSPDSEGFISVVHRVVNSDQSIRWLHARKQVKFIGKLSNGNPKPATGLVAIKDITEFKEAEARIEYLMGEVSHRSKNMLSVVQGIARLTARNSSPEDFIPQFTARLGALGANQAILVDDKWTNIDITRLAASHMEPYTDGKQDRVTMAGPHIVLNEKSAQSIGMALHELATNAVKYGALSNASGKVAVSWTIGSGPNPEFTIDWAETGGPAVNAPSRTGFGETVIRQVASSSVSGKVALEYNPAGVRWTLTAPLCNISARPRQVA